MGRYCASVDDEEIAEGLKIVERQLGEKTVRAGEHELFKARAKDKGHVKLIDIITARLDAGTDSFLATLPSLQLKDVRISEEMVHANERMLTGVRDRTVVFGHSHQQFRRPGPNGTDLVNPGSAGMPLDGDVRGAWATWDGDFEFRRTEYDVARAAAGYRSMGGDFGEFAATRIERGSD